MVKRSIESMLSAIECSIDSIMASVEELSDKSLRISCVHDTLSTYIDNEGWIRGVKCRKCGYELVDGYSGRRVFSVKRIHKHLVRRFRNEL